MLADTKDLPAHFVTTGFAEQLTAHRPNLRSHARRLCRDGDLAEDLVQETLLRAWKAQSQFKPGTQLRAWLFTILRNVFRTHLRRVRHHLSLDDGTMPAAGSLSENQTSSVELRQVAAAMQLLPLDQGIALHLIAIDGLSYDEAAQLIDISLPSLKSRVHRARLSLLEIFK